MNRLLMEDFAGVASECDIEKFRGKSIHITGATGFIGGYLTRFFLYLNDYFSTEIMLHLQIRNEPKAVDMFGNRKDIFYNSLYVDDIIFHCASPATPIANETYFTDCIDANVSMTLSLLEKALRNKSKMVFVSAGEIYGNAISPIAETDYGPIDPLLTRSNYAETKRVGENLCHSYTLKYGVETYIVRLFHTYGIGINLDDPRIFSKVVKSAVKQEPIILHTKQNVVRAFCYISDVVKGILTVLDKGVSGEAYNIGMDNGTCVEALALYVNGKYGVPLRYDLTSGYVGSPYGDLVPSCAKLRSLGWNPSVNLTDGFDRTIEYYKEEGCAHMS